MKQEIFTLAFLLLSFFSIAQEELTFDKRYFQCEDKYIAFPYDEEDKDYAFGFIYLDEEAGFTWQYMGSFVIDKDGKYKADTATMESTNLKVRLEPNTRKMAIISDEKVEEMGFALMPYWLRFYKETDNKVKSLVRRGYHYNHVGQCEKALTYLEEAYQLESTAKGLAFELAYAYNHLTKFERAVGVLERAVKREPENFYLHRELGFSYLMLEEMENAENTYAVALGIKGKRYDFLKAEMGTNMAREYFKQKKKSKMKKWIKVVKKYAEKNSDFLKAVKYFEENI